MDRDYIMLMGPWGSTGPVEVTPVRIGRPHIELPPEVQRRADEATGLDERAHEGLYIEREP